MQKFIRIMLVIALAIFAILFIADRVTQAQEVETSVKSGRTVVVYSQDGSYKTVITQADGNKVTYNSNGEVSQTIVNKDGSETEYCSGECD